MDAETGHDIVERFVAFTKGPWAAAVAAAFGMPEARIGTVSVIPDELMPEDTAFFTTMSYPPDTILGSMVPPGSVMTILNVGTETALLLGVFLEGRTPELPPELRRELLDAVAQSLLVLAHETVHSLRVSSIENVALLEAAMKAPGVKPMFEALTQAATEIQFGEILVASGMAALDRDIGAANAANELFYSGVADIGRVLIAAVADHSRVSRGDLADAVAARHFGPDAVEFLIATYVAAATGSEASPLAAGAMVDTYAQMTEADSAITSVIADADRSLAARVATARGIGSRYAQRILDTWDALAIAIAAPGGRGFGGLQ